MIRSIYFDDEHEEKLKELAEIMPVDSLSKIVSGAIDIAINYFKDFSNMNSDTIYTYIKKLEQE